MTGKSLLSKPIFTLISGLLTFVVLGFFLFRPDQVPPTPASGELIVSNVFVESVNVLLIESPPQAHAVVKGEFPDGCYEIADIIKRREDNHFIINITSQRPSDVVCRQAFKSFEEVVPLEIADLPSGTYTVTSGSVSADFTLSAAIPQPE